MKSRRGPDLFGSRRRTSLGSPLPVPGPRHAWGVLAFSAATLLGMVRTGWLMRAVILDVVSLWPVPLVAIAVVLVHDRLAKHNEGAVRTGASVGVPLLLFTWLAAGLGLYMTGWGELPSSAVTLNGRSVTDQVTVAVLEIETGGEVVLEGGGEILYQATPLRTGGMTAPAQGSERLSGNEVTVSLREGPDPGWFGSRGWKVSVSSSPDWDLMVRARNLVADLTSIGLQSLSVRADGRVRLGTPSGDVPIRLDGGLVLEVPSGASVEVSGPAEVGPGWEVTATGTRYVGTSESRFLVTVEPGSDLVVEQW